MSSGKIVQIIGAVLDVEFPSESIPPIITTESSKLLSAITVDSGITTLVSE